MPSEKFAAWWSTADIDPLERTSFPHGPGFDPAAYDESIGRMNRGKKLPDEKRPSGRLEPVPEGYPRADAAHERLLIEREIVRVEREIKENVEILCASPRLEDALKALLRTFAKTPEHGDLLLREVPGMGRNAGQVLGGHRLKPAHLQMLALSTRLRNLRMRLDGSQKSRVSEAPPIERPSLDPRPSTEPPRPENEDAALAADWEKYDRLLTNDEARVRDLFGRLLLEPNLGPETRRALRFVQDELRSDDLEWILRDAIVVRELDWFLSMPDRDLSHTLDGLRATTVRIKGLRELLRRTEDRIRERRASGAAGTTGAHRDSKTRS